MKSIALQGARKIAASKRKSVKDIRITTHEPSDKMVEAAAGYIHAQTDATKETAIRVARAALKAAFAAAIESGEAREAKAYRDHPDGGWLYSTFDEGSDFHVIILRTQEGEK